MTLQQFSPKKIYIWVYEWQPGANTIAYYPFESDINDYSGNSRNLSMYTGNFSYQTLSSGKKYCKFNTSALARNTSIPFNRTAYTISGWCYWDATSTSYQKMILDLLGGSNYRPRFWTMNSFISGMVSYDSGPAFTANKWYHIVVTYDNDISTIYIDNSQIGQVTYSYSATTATMIINGTNANSYNVNYRTNGGISELILEDKARTAQEVSDYYNSTKGLYGIS